MRPFSFACTALTLAVSCAYAQPPSTPPVKKVELPPVVTWKFNLVKAAKQTSAGVYDQSGCLVRTLWTMKPMSAGEQTAGWDGKDAEGKTAPAGKYSYKIAVSNAIYKNVNVFGNSGTSTFSHVPNNFEAVAVDTDGDAYTVHDWDEPHHDVKMWSAKDGSVVSHSGHVFGGLLKAVAVDDEFAYVTGYENLDNRKEAKFSIAKARIDKTPPKNNLPGAQNWQRVSFTKAGSDIYVYDGKADYPDGASEADKSVMRMPLLSLAIAGNTLLCTDSLAGKVRMFDKVTGEETGALDAKLAQAVAVGADGRIWVGHENTKVSVFSADGKLLATPIDDLKGINALAVHGNTLYVADTGASQVKIYDIAENTAKFNRSFGDPARPGDRASHRFRTLHGVAVDKDGNIVTVQDEYFFNGGRVAKFSPDGKPLWEEQGLDFVSNAIYSQTSPDWAVSLQHHGYQLDRKTGTVSSTGNTYSGDGYKSTIGPISAHKLGANEFVFMANGDGMIVYRVVPAPDKFRGPSLRLASIVAGSNPLPNGNIAAEFWKPENFYQWSWHDEAGDGKIDDGEQLITDKPGNGKQVWQHGSLTADDKGNLWFASYDRGGITPEQNSIWVIPNLGLDKMGNPTYDWDRALRVMASNTLPYEAQARLAVRAPDGMLYVYGTSRRDGMPHTDGLHMGGNTLGAFDLKKWDPLKWQGKDDKDRLADMATKPRWNVIPPEMYVGLDVLPARADGTGSGVVIGGYPGRGGVYHYTQDGLLIGGFNSDEKRFGGPDNGNNPSGLIDFFGGVAANRDPRDGIADVFVEDDFNDRIFWYRADDRDIQTISGTVEIT